MAPSENEFDTPDIDDRCSYIDMDIEIGTDINVHIDIDTHKFFLGWLNFIFHKTVTDSYRQNTN